MRGSEPFSRGKVLPAAPCLTTLGRSQGRIARRLERPRERGHGSRPTGDGVQELVRGIADALDKIPKETFEDEEAETGLAGEAEALEEEVLSVEAYEADDEEPSEDDQEAGAASGKNS